MTLDELKERFCGQQYVLQTEKGLFVSLDNAIAGIDQAHELGKEEGYLLGHSQGLANGGLRKGTDKDKQRYRDKIRQQTVREVLESIKALKKPVATWPGTEIKIGYQVQAVCSPESYNVSLEDLENQLRTKYLTKQE